MTERYGEVKSKAEQVEGTQEWVKKQVREELIKLNKECFYEVKGEEVTYNMDTVKHYLNSIKDKKTWKELTMSNSSVLIMAVQIALYSQNYQFGRIDGLLGPKTKAAIKKFQADNGLTVDAYGRSMPTTIAKLLEKITPMETVELSEAEKAEYYIFRPKDEDKKEDIKPYSRDNVGTEQHVWNPTQQEKTKEQVQIPYRPAESEDKPKENKPEENPKFITDTLPEWVTEQDKIRPEVQSMIDNYRNEVDKFHTLKEISLAEAKAIGELPGSFIDLSGLEKLTPQSFEALLKFNGGIDLGVKELTPDMAKKLEGHRYSVSFKGLENISKETAEELGKTTCALDFGAMKSFDSTILESLIKKPSGNLEFSGIETIDDESAKVLAKYQGNIILNNVKTISGSVAKILGAKKNGVFLKGLDASKPLPQDVLEGLSQLNIGLNLNNDTFAQIYDFRIEQKRKGKNLTKTVVDTLDHKEREDELSKLKRITKDDAEALAERSRYRDLSGLEFIDAEAFEALMKCKGELTLGFDEIPDDYVKYIEMRTGGLHLKGLTEINQNLAKSLAKTYGRLTFDSVTKLEKPVAEELSKKYSGELSFNGITELTTDIVNSFKDYQGRVSFDNVTNITPEIAQLLKEKNRGFISLRGIKAPISEDMIQILSHAKNVYLNPDVVGQIHKYIHPELYK